MAKIIEARVIQKVATEAEWLRTTLPLYQGEIALVRSGNRVVNMKVGNGTSKFSELNYVYNGGFNGSINPSTATTELQNGFYIAEVSGTYNNAGGIVVQDGYYTILEKYSGGWKKSTEVKMPMLSAEGKVEEGNEEAVSGGEVYEKLSENKIHVFDPEKADGYQEGNEFIYAGILYKVKNGQSLAMGELPTESLEKLNILLNTNSDILVKTEGNNLLVVTDIDNNVLFRIDKKGYLKAKIDESDTPVTGKIEEEDTNDAVGKLFRFQDDTGNVLASIDKEGTLNVKKLSASEIEGVTDSETISPNSMVTELEEYTMPRYEFLTMKIVGQLPTDASPDRTPTNVIITLNNGVENLITFGAEMSIQGAGSAGYRKKGYNIDMVNANGDDFKLKIGDMISTDSFHVKAFHTDITHTRDVGNGRLWQEMYQTRSYPYNFVRPVPPPTEFVSLDEYNNKTVYTEDAKFFTDGIPCQIIIGGVFVGLYTLRLKKTRENYALDRDNENHIFAENAITGRYLGRQHYETYEDWIESWELRTPRKATQTTKDNILRFFNWWEDVYNGDVSLADTYQDYIVLESWIDFYIIAELIGHRDIDGNNTLINTYDGTHWQIFLYDTDNSIGIFSTLNPPPAGLSISADIWTAVRTQLLPQIKDRYQFLREAGIFSNENFKKIYGGISDKIPRSVYEQNYKRWGCQTTNGIPTMEQIYGFLNDRLNTLDNLWINN